MGTGQPHRHPQQYAPTDTLRGRLRRLQRNTGPCPDGGKQNKIGRKQTLRQAEEGSEECPQFDDFFKTHAVIQVSLSNSTCVGEDE